jgi:hypothetical protein
MSINSHSYNSFALLNKVEDYVFDVARRLGYNYFESEAVNETWYDNLALSINM